MCKKCDGFSEEFYQHIDTIDDEGWKEEYSQWLDELETAAA